MKKNDNAVQRLLAGELSNSSYKQVSDYESIKKRLSVVNKSMYRTGLVYDPISLLEKSALTGRIFDKKEPQPKKKTPHTPDPLSISLRPEHKNNKSIKIYQLPKLPFGSHHNYNEEHQFVSEHFKFDDRPDELTKNLEVLTRRFRLNDKNYAKRAKSSHQRKKINFQPNSDYFKMECGYLICKKEKEITEIYEKDKDRYTKELAATTFTDFERIKIDEKVNDLHIDKKCETGVVKRLYPAREDVETPVSKFYKTKYSALFSNEPSTRPMTSFQITPWKNMLN